MGGKIGIRKRFSLTSFIMTMWVLLGPRIVQVFSLNSTQKPFWHILETDSNILHRSGMYNTSSMLTFTLGPVRHFLTYFFIDTPQTCREHLESTINSSRVVWMVLVCSESAF